MSIQNFERQIKTVIHFFMSLIT